MSYALAGDAMRNLLESLGQLCVLLFGIVLLLRAVFLLSPITALILSPAILVLLFCMTAPAVERERQLREASWKRLREISANEDSQK